MGDPVRLQAIDGGVRVAFDVDIEKVEKFRKRATFSKFTFDCDEGPLLGGTDSAPYPMVYFAASLAF